MSRSYPANTQRQKFLEESYNKERDARLSWFREQSKEGPAQASKQYEVFRKKIEAAAPRPTARLAELKDVKSKSYHKRKVRQDDHLVKLAGEGSARQGPVVDMRPVDSRVKSQLYDGFTKEGKGRYQYLQERYTTVPERKYEFPVLSSWEYGWRLDDVIRKEDIKKPDNGRTRIVADTFYTRTGIPDLTARKRLEAF